MSILESVFALGSVVGVVFLLHVAVLVFAVAALIWDLIHVIWFRVICRRFTIDRRGLVSRTINAIDDTAERLLLKPLDMYVAGWDWCWDRLTGKSRRELVKRVKHLEAQVDSLVELRGRTELLLKREGALICRAEKAERRLAETEKVIDGYPEVRYNDHLMDPC